MAKTSASNDEPTGEEVDAPEQTDAPPEETPPEGEEVEQATETEPQAATFELPPTLKDAGLNGVVATSSGQYSTPGGSSFFLTPGQGYAMSPEDAQALIDMGVAKALDDTSAPT
jgi:hypothetical protein